MQFQQYLDDSRSMIRHYVRRIRTYWSASSGESSFFHLFPQTILHLSNFTDAEVTITGPFDTSHSIRSIHWQLPVTMPADCSLGITSLILKSLRDVGEAIPGPAGGLVKACAGVAVTIIENIQV